MKKLRLLSTLCVTVISLCVVVPAEATLISRAGGAAAYDTVLDITWTTDAGVSGRGNWDRQIAWANDLDYLGFHEWRLASMSVSTGLPTGLLPGTPFDSLSCNRVTEKQCQNNELGYMFYYNLGGSLGDSLVGDHVVGDVGLSNIQDFYWSGTEADSPYAWRFGFFTGTSDLNVKYDSIFGWAVHDGDVAGVAEPPMILLLATGLLGLIGIARRKAA